MRWFFEVASIWISSSWKWLLASVAVIGGVVALLFAVGVFGGGGDSSSLPLAASPTPTPAATATPVPAATATPVPEPTAGPESKVVSVPILATRANNVGSLEFVLVFDPAILEFAEIEGGVLAGSALIDASSPRPGELWAGIVHAEGISGSGAVAVVKFNLLEDVSDALPLTLQNIVAFDANTYVDIITTTSPGRFNGVDLVALSPIVTFQ